MDNLLSSTFFKCGFCKLLTKIVNRESVTLDDFKPPVIDNEIKNLFQNDNIMTPNSLFANNAFMFNSFIPKNTNTSYLENHETYATPKVNRALFISPDTRNSPINRSGKFDLYSEYFFAEEYGIDYS